MKKLAIIALAALALAPAGANAGTWDNFTCIMFEVNCHNSHITGAWWNVVGWFS